MCTWGLLQPDLLNRIAVGLGNGLTAKQVSKLLIKCNIVADEAAARKGAKLAAERAQLVSLCSVHLQHAPRCYVLYISGPPQRHCVAQPRVCA